MADKAIVEKLESIVLAVGMLNDTNISVMPMFYGMLAILEVIGNELPSENVCVGNNT